MILTMIMCDDDYALDDDHDDDDHALDDDDWETGVAGDSSLCRGLQSHLPSPQACQWTGRPTRR